MRVPDAEVRRHVVECVKSFYSCVAPKELPDGTDCHLQPKTRTVPSDCRFTKLSLSEVPSRVQLWLSYISFSFSIQSCWHCFVVFWYFFVLCVFQFSTKPAMQSYIFSIWLFHTGLQSTSHGYRLQLLERSDLAQTLLLSTAVLEKQPDIRVQLLQTLQILSCASGLQAWFILGFSGKVEGGRRTRQSRQPLLHYEMK